MIIDQCNWNHPGVNPYSGEASAAIMAFVEIPEPVRRELVAKVARHEFDDAVLIDNDSIRGKHDYTDLRSMHFGRGDICRKVTWHWAADRTEGGWVYCASGYCVLMPAPCRNWSIVTRAKAPEQAALPYQYLGSDEAFAPLEVLPAPGFAPGSGPILEQALGTAAAGEAPVSFPSFGSAGGGGGNTYITSPCTCCSAVAAPIPEPATYLLLALGLAGIAIRKYLKRT